MNLISLSKEELKEQLFILMESVYNVLKIEPDVDKFLDETDLFEAWEKSIPDAEYPIFIMAVLNNSRREAIIDAILDAILKKNNQMIISNKSSSEPNNKRSFIGEHPFN